MISGCTITINTPSDTSSGDSEIGITVPSETSESNITETSLNEENMQQDEAVTEPEEEEVFNTVKLEVTKGKCAELSWKYYTEKFQSANLLRSLDNINFSSIGLFRDNNTYKDCNIDSYEDFYKYDSTYYYYKIEVYDYTGLTLISNIVNVTNTPCIPNWSCTEWSNCSSTRSQGYYSNGNLIGDNPLPGNMSRVCVDYNKCNTDFTKPEESKGCQMPLCPNRYVYYSGVCRYVKCINITEIDDNNVCTIDKCQYPGTPESYEEHVAVTCCDGCKSSCAQCYVRPEDNVAWSLCPAPKAESLSCCNGQPFNFNTQGCCSGQIFNLSTHGCCVGQIYALSTHACCILPTTGQVYTPTTQGCVLIKVGEHTSEGITYDDLANTVYDLNVNGVCGRQLFTLSTQGCCNVGTLQTPTIFNINTQTCCSNQIINGTSCN